VGELRGPLETQLLKGRSVSCLVFPSVALRCLARIEDDAASAHGCQPGVRYHFLSANGQSS